MDFLEQGRGPQGGKWKKGRGEERCREGKEEGGQERRKRGGKDGKMDREGKEKEDGGEGGEGRGGGLSSIFAYRNNVRNPTYSNNVKIYVTLYI